MYIHQRGKCVPIIILVGMVILLSGCGIRATPTYNDMRLSQTPLTLSLPMLTSTLKAPLPTVTFTVQPPSPTPLSKATETTLDPNHWKHFTLPNDVLHSDVQHIGQAEDGTMWFGGYQIYRYDGTNWLIYNPEKISGFRGHVIESLAVAPGGIVWVGTEMNEIVSFDGVTWRSQTVEKGGYRKNKIVSIVPRKNGELCAVSIEAMSCQRNGKWTHHPIVIRKSVNDRVYVGNAALTPADEIWVPISNGSIYYYDGEKWESSNISSSLGTISANPDGSLWLVVYDPALLNYQMRLGRRDAHGNVVYIEKMPHIIEESSALAIREAKDGTVWLGTGGGYELAHYVNGLFLDANGDSSFSLPRDFKTSPFSHVSCVFESKDGSMWFGTIKGIFRYK